MEKGGRACEIGDSTISHRRGGRLDAVGGRAGMTRRRTDPDAPSPLSQEASTDRLFLTTIGLSLVGHVAVFGAQLATGGWAEWAQAKTPVQLVYEPETEERSRWAATADPDRIQVRFQDAPEPTRVAATA